MGTYVAGTADESEPIPCLWRATSHRARLTSVPGSPPCLASHSARLTFVPSSPGLPPCTAHCSRPLLLPLPTTHPLTKNETTPRDVRTPKV